MPIQQLKHQLLEKKALLERQMAAIHRDFAQGRDADSAEQAVERENEQVLNSLEQHAATELAQISVALQRMEAGTYQQCQQCGEDIAIARLAAIPFTNLCIRCAS
ncbi:TraR/DksA family transcriptional regulator [Arsukibacterium sp.]|uniref:TraR/DksA family transcriptional regulator n=1 Tax=Arsukibacterium sp. TaxID=1977258 RepID=UPI002FD91106